MAIVLSGIEIVDREKEPSLRSKRTWIGGFHQTHTGASDMCRLSTSLSAAGCRCLLWVIVIAATMTVADTAMGAGPKGKAPEAKGLRIWQDKEGWHLVSHTAPGHVHIFTGTIKVVGAKISSTKGIDKIEKGDFWKINTTTNTVTFRLTTNGKWDRVEFKLNQYAEKLIFDVREDGKAKPERIYIGHAGKHPDGIPFTLPGKSDK
jgi:hypothetical protein